MINESLLCVANNEDTDDYDLDVSDDMKELSDIDEHPTATLLMEVAKKTQWLGGLFHSGSGGNIILLYSVFCFTVDVTSVASYVICSCLYD